MTEKILAAIKEVREKSKKRNFSQTFDLIVNLKNIDLKKPENRISKNIVLPHAEWKKNRIAFFVDTLASKVRDFKDIEVINKESVGKIEKKRIKKIDYLFAETSLMPLIGKTFGETLAPLGKMPTPISPVVKDLKPLIDNAKRMIRFRLKDSPVIQLPVGIEEMRNEDIAENIIKVMEEVEAALPKRKEQIKNVYIKLTMGPIIKVKI